MENLIKNLVSIQKLRSFPMVNYISGYLSKVFFNEEEHPTIAEVTKRIGEVALSFADKISLPTELEEQISIMDQLAAKGLCTLEKKYPFIINEPDQILELFKESYVSVLHKTGSGTTEMKSSMSDKLEKIYCKINSSQFWHKVDKIGEDLLDVTEIVVDLLMPPTDEEREHSILHYHYLMKRSADLLVTALRRVLARTGVKNILTVSIATFDDMPLVARSLSFILWIYIILTGNHSTS